MKRDQVSDCTLPALDAPHYQGHRERLRARFLDSGAAALSDYELLELVLFAAIPRRDVGDGAIAQLKIIEAAALRLSRTMLMGKPALSSWNALLDYCAAAMARAPKEEFRVLFLDRKNFLIGDEVMNKGTVDHAPVYPREIVKRALELSASALILVHNHPSGDPTPSRADIEMTREVVEAARALRIAVHDHLVIGRGGTASFKALGLL